MARTKNKAKKCTGGKAPRKPFGQKPAARAPDSGAKWNAPTASEADPWCVICYNGGTLLECECNWAVCFECLPQAKALSPAVIASSVFKCPSCEGCLKVPSICYRGLYDASGVPLFPDGLKVESTTYSSLKSPLKIPRICIIDITLVGLSYKGGPGHLLSQYLLPWYDPFADQHRLLYCQHTLDFAGTSMEIELATLQQFGERAAAYDRVLVFLCTHSDSDRGDLFWEPAGALGVADFFRDVLSTLLNSIAAVESTFFLLSCGSVVSKSESLSELRASVKKYNINQCFAFGAEGLVPNVTFPFVQEYVMSIILRGRDVVETLEDILDQCRSVGRHTHILWFRPTGEMVRYAWTESVVRPWGQILPIQCGTCMSVYSWRKEKTAGNGDIVFCCMGRTSQGVDCGARYTVSNKFNLAPTKKPHRGTWLKA